MSVPEQKRVDIGDIELAALHWPGEGPPILLLHATGFHSHCWRQVVGHLPGRDVYALDLRYHGRSGASGAVSWLTMANDVALFIEAMGLQDIVGVGHSIGGYLIATVAANDPDRFRHLVLIDPVICSPQRYVHFNSGGGGFRPEDHPVARRKNAWQDAHQMYERFLDRPPFDTWNPRVLRDYCDYGLESDAQDGVYRLACDPLHESSVYAAQAGNEVILDRLAEITTPVTLLRAPPGADGEPHDFTHSPTWEALGQNLPRCEEVYLEDLNHFMPMQRPELVAQYILAVG